MLEMLKAIEYIYQRHMMSILDVINHANQHRSVMIITILGKAKVRLLNLAACFEAKLMSLTKYFSNTISDSLLPPRESFYLLPVV